MLIANKRQLAGSHRSLLSETSFVFKSVGDRSELTTVCAPSLSSSPSRPVLSPSLTVHLALWLPSLASRVHARRPIDDVSRADLVEYTLLIRQVHNSFLPVPLFTSLSICRSIRLSNFTCPECTVGRQTVGESVFAYLFSPCPPVCPSSQLGRDDEIDHQPASQSAVYRWLSRRPI